MLDYVSFIYIFEIIISIINCLIKIKSKQFSGITMVDTKFSIENFTTFEC